MIEKAIEKLEYRLLDPRVRRSKPELLGLLHKDFAEFGSSGQVYDRDKVISTLLKSNDVSGAVISNFQCHQDANTVHAQYHLKVTDRQGNFWLSLRSSVWVNKGPSWRMIFHQGTRI